VWCVCKVVSWTVVRVVCVCVCVCCSCCMCVCCSCCMCVCCSCVVRVLVVLVLWCAHVLLRAFSSDGRAPASHAGGRGIDTPNVHFFPRQPPCMHATHTHSSLVCLCFDIRPRQCYSRSHSLPSRSRARICSHHIVRRNERRGQASMYVPHRPDARLTCSSMPNRSDSHQQQQPNEG
jgi:hypothetical protein